MTDVAPEVTDFDRLVWSRLPEQFEPKRRQWATPGKMARDLNPTNHRTTAALDLIYQEIADWADDISSRFLMIFCPPQEGKSQAVSRRTPAWLLVDDPTLKIAIVSFEQERAVRWGREIKRDIETHPQLDIQLRPDSKAAGRWHTEQGGGVYCVGLGGALTGERVDVLIIDDPVKGRREAESATQRQYAWDWWESVGSTRLSSRGRVCLMMTRWHEDDLAGRLLVNEPGRWRVVRIPAIAEDDDPIGRAPGEELVSVQGRAPGYFLGLRDTRSPYVWLSIFMQTPSAAEGLIFKKLWWRYWREAPSLGYGTRVDLGGQIWPIAEMWRFATMDLAVSERASADFTVAAAWGISLDGDVILLDLVRERVGEGKHFGLVRPLVERWKLDTVFVERSQYGTTLAVDATRQGAHLTPIDAETDKVTRAQPASARCAGGRVWLPADAPWLEKFRTELAQFPTGAHDDQVDVLSYAVRVAVTKWHPRPPRLPRRSAELDFLTVAL